MDSSATTEIWAEESFHQKNPRDFLAKFVIVLIFRNSQPVVWVSSKLEATFLLFRHSFTFFSY